MRYYDCTQCRTIRIILLKHHIVPGFLGGGGRCRIASANRCGISVIIIVRINTESILACAIAAGGGRRCALLYVRKSKDDSGDSDSTTTASTVRRCAPFTIAQRTAAAGWLACGPRTEHNPNSVLYGSLQQSTIRIVCMYMHIGFAHPSRTHTHTHAYLFDVELCAACLWCTVAVPPTPPVRFAPDRTKTLSLWLRCKCVCMVICSRQE